MARQVLENGVILPAEYSDDWYDDMTSNLTKLDDVIGSDSEKLSSADVGAAALSNNYNDLDNLPTIPTVNNAALTIQKNGVDVQTFTANASSNVTCNITVPTKTSDLTNDSNFVVSSSLANVATSGDYDDLSNKPSIPTNTSDLTNDSNFVDTSNPAVSSGITSAKVTDYDTHIADTDIHVTTADKATWNTVTSKANDSDVVHKSGDETVIGNKRFGVVQSFTGYPSIRLYSTIDDINVLPSYTQQVDIRFTDKNSALIAYFIFQHRNDANEPFRTCWRQLRLDGTDNYYSVDFNNLGEFYPENNNAINLGGSGNRWKSVYAMNYYYGNDNVEFSTKFVTTDTAQTISGNKTFSSINGVEPSSLSLPSDRSARIDISSYFTNTGTGDTNNYTVPANGYIYMEVADCISLYMYSQTTGNLSNYGNSVCRNTIGKVVGFLPVRKGDVFTSQWYTTLTNVSLTSAFFIPCQGNV